MTWFYLQQLIKPYLIRIESQQGSGTGFLFAYTPGGDLAAIATAAHVIQHASDWKQPIKLIHDATGETAFVPEEGRAILLKEKRDAATILVPKNILPFPDQLLPLTDPKNYYKVGSDLAWTGFPSVAYPTLCFFSGRISAFLEPEDCYLIDGVAINGVSGGPVFIEREENELEIVGIISAYLSNNSANTPGLLRAQDITPIVDTLNELKNMHEAKQKESQDQSPPAPPK